MTTNDQPRSMMPPLPRNCEATIARNPRRRALIQDLDAVIENFSRLQTFKSTFREDLLFS
ncbi:hypothetical protein TorRG33x02_284330 [Trema orientale]|uniref:Uncharacterized protein n=1 Tax=Trema orientale TaxID=63057 RepID=A0A2P5CHX3_TREOI|nr:hypothetical protein TorRG33x02_284290 [Trema orientale]PON60628.1 hypothetical protein TorRG33x02_284330 [Trema orientale]